MSRDMEIFIIFFYILVVIAIWLNILASVAIKYDHFLTSFQKKAQLILVWLFPFIGASVILHIVFDHEPEAIPKSLIPWPFKSIIYGKANKLNKNRGHSSIDHCGASTDSSGGDGGGGGD